MRSEVIDSIYHLMIEDKRIFFLTNDLGYGTLERIEKEFPKRFVNVGIAEQNMIGIAAGLSLSGKKVYCYSISTFLTMRCFEQIRDDLCYHNLDVILLGVGSGFTYGILGSTHFALEDIAILRSLPNMIIVSPADAQEAKQAVLSLYKRAGPSYLRIGKKIEPVIFEKLQPFTIGKGVFLQKGKNVVIFTTGTITGEVIQAAKLLEERKHIRPTVINIHTIKPIDKKLILGQLQANSFLVTVEEHGIIGGLGSAIAEIIVEQKTRSKLVRIGTPDTFIKKIGTQAYLRKQHKIDSEGIYQQIIDQL